MVLRLPQNKGPDFDKSFLIFIDGNLFINKNVRIQMCGVLNMSYQSERRSGSNQSCQNLQINLIVLVL